MEWVSQNVWCIGRPCFFSDELVYSFWPKVLTFNWKSQSILKCWYSLHALDLFFIDWVDGTMVVSSSWVPIPRLATLSWNGSGMEYGKAREVRWVRMVGWNTETCKGENQDIMNERVLSYKYKIPWKPHYTTKRYRYEIYEYDEHLWSTCEINLWNHMVCTWNPFGNLFQCTPSVDWTTILPVLRRWMLRRTRAITDKVRPYGIINHHHPPKALVRPYLWQWQSGVTLRLPWYVWNFAGSI